MCVYKGKMLCMIKYGLMMLIVLASSCNKEKDDSLTPDRELQMEELMGSLSYFQWHLFQQSVASDQSGKNLNISPLSIAAALYMTYEGSAGTTRDGISETLALHSAQAGFNLGQAYEDLIHELEKTDAVLETSNAVFWDKNRIFPKEEFLQYTSDYFDAGRFDLAFEDPAALAAINDWVKTATEGRIDKILDEISQEEVMFLINALYFKDDWQFPFPEESTRVGDFVRKDGKIVQAQMMYQDINTLRYYQNSDFSAVEMPFADTAYSLVLMLPPDGKNPDQLIAQLEPERMETLYEQDLKTGRILLDLPKFEIEYKVLLNDVLKNMGMTLAFDPNEADFSNLGTAPEGNLFISKVLHKTYLKIDEKGAEGAAVTSVGVGVTSLPPQLRFDRPFVFLLLNKKTGALIFAGKIEDPNVR
jgi:serpin B